ncbi:MAG: hypothetical protein MJ240_10335 [Kiritimatiellae bacterium]|nr:hypothetical protein [Kiritimatiellia bacterium]
MKKIMLALGVVGLSVAALAAVNDSLLMFSTKGPDKYADGTMVLDGECYALCYVTDAEAFAIKADGTAAAGGEVLLTAPVAQGGKCPDLLYVVPAEKAEALTGGSYGVYLLDTRVKAADGSVAPAGVVGGKAAVVNAAGSVATGGSVGTGTEGVASFNGTVVEGGSATALSVIDKPAITAIKVEGAKVKLTVSGLSPAADYTVVAGSDPTGVTTLKATTIEGNTLTVDAAGAKFFKVLGTRKF